MAHDVFISYSIKDKHTAETVLNKLESDGIRCWIAPRDILPGKEWAEAIADAIPKSTAMILIFSSFSNQSKQVLREVEIAISTGVVLLPVKIEDTKATGGMLYYLSTTHWIDAIGTKLNKTCSILSKRVKSLIETKTPIVNNTQQDINFEDARPVPRKKRKALLISLISIVMILALSAVYFFVPGFWNNTSEFESLTPSQTPSSAPSPTNWKTIAPRTPSPLPSGPDYPEYTNGNYPLPSSDFGYEDNRHVPLSEPLSEAVEYYLKNDFTLKYFDQPYDDIELTVYDAFKIYHLNLLAPEREEFDFNGMEVVVSYVDSFQPFEIQYVRQADILNLAGLQYMKNLLGLGLIGYNIDDFLPIQPLENLLYLKIDQAEINDISFLSNLVNLEWLEIIGLNTENIESLHSLNKLHYLRLDTWPNLSTFNKVYDMSFLNSFNDLEDLLIRLPIKNIEDVDILPNLICLEMQESSLTDISFLSKCTKLTNLNLASNNISDISSLSGLTELLSLNLSDNKISSLDSLYNLINLKELYVDKSTYDNNKQIIEHLQSNGCVVYPLKNE